MVPQPASQVVHNSVLNTHPKGRTPAKAMFFLKQPNDLTTKKEEKKRRRQPKCPDTFPKLDGLGGDGFAQAWVDASEDPTRQ
ncbi:hypothetical protein QVD17_34510 [Tagetes erecta]|uniref:Uncharacterized protein n=1 Tax=Tagetes erecta TaxID=13708 RepID=A0AAD8JXY3_TARER|nr:hypothetical protein QVD17_34510 [Tagetes erecta]